VIDAPDKIAPLIGNLLPYRKTEPVEQVAKVPDPLEQAARMPALPKRQEVDSALASEAESQWVDARADVSGLGARERRAVEAYSSLENTDRREYVRQVMGIDEFA
jgi:hypothetical protein